MSDMTVYVVEVYLTTTDETCGFHSVTTDCLENLATLATDLCIAFNHGLGGGGTDWRQIAEHPYRPRPTAPVPIGGDK